MLAAPHPAMTARRSFQHPAVRRAAVLVLLVALVLAQALGWMHRAVHGDTGVVARLAVSAAQPPGDTELHAQGPFEALFGSHADASDCRLFDVLAHAGCASAATPLLPLAPVAAFLLASPGDFVVRWSAPFDARGPPTSR
jgi:hypothetical protein